jgi:hypothetical protein
MIVIEKPTDRPDLERETPGTIVEETEPQEEVLKAELHSGDQVLVRTAHSTYAIRVLGDGLYSVSGGWFDRRGVSPLKTTITGCTWGRSAIKLDTVAACGLHLEFGNGVVTSRIREIDVTRFGEHRNN